MGSLRSSSCQERSLGHHPDICSSVKPPHITLCCILTFIPSYSVMSMFENYPDTVSCSKVCHKVCMYELTMCIHWYLTYLFGPMPTEEPALLFQWPAAWYSLCLWAPSVEWSGPVWRGAVYCSFRHWEQKQDWEACVGSFFTALLNSALHYTHTTQINTYLPDTVDMETTVIRTQNFRSFYKEKVGNRPRKFNRITNESRTKRIKTIAENGHSVKN